MSIAATAEQVRAAYLDRLYISAMLRDPHPRRAGEAVVAAWASAGREDARLDLHTEARFVASLPPLNLRRFARPERTRRLPGLPAEFWRLPPTTRLALGLWLLRRMPVPLIADALHLSPSQTQTILFDGLISLTEELSNLPDESKCWLRARLDDSPAGRSHLLRCESCRSALGIWERAEDELATQLQAALGDISVPRSVAEAVRARLDVGQQRRTLAPWRSQLVLRLATVLAALIVLAALLYGFPAEAVSKPPLPATGPGAMIDGRVQAGSPRSFVEAARAAYLRVPETNGIVHRRWEISPVQAGPVWQADEWIDAQEPGRYRMQLLDGQQVKEWQTGDGTSALRYASTLAPLFCGPAPVGLDRHLGEINVWRMGAAEQTQMRVARWQAAPWSAGLYYLDVAARADSLRSLGLSGSGDAAVLTLAAEGRTFDGMLLLRLDPRTFDLREVRELRIDNGQTIAYVPWRLVQDETIDGMTARRQNLLAAYPDAQIPESIRREPGILDRTCPLIGREQALSLPRMLGLGLPGPIGLPAPPPGTDRAVLLGRPDSSASQVIYLGPGKRLALLFESAPTGRSRRLDVGTWHTPFVDRAPGVITSRIWEPQPETAPGHTGRPVWVLDLWAQGWSQDELAALIETVRRLRPDDWARRPDLFYDPQPLDAQTRAQVIPILSAAAPHAGRTLHRVMTATVRQPSFFASLPDPYHLPAGAWPATRRVESWVEVDEQGVSRRWRWTETGSHGELLSAGWNDGRTQGGYEALGDALVAGTARRISPLIDDTAPDGITDDTTSSLLLAPGWQWQPASQGGAAAERLEELALPSTRIARHTPGAVDRWVGDLAVKAGKRRVVFGPDGILRSSETLAIVDDPSRLAATTGHVYDRRVAALPAPPSMRLVIDSVVIETSEWLPAVPDATFSFTPPPSAIPATHFVGRGDPGPTRIVFSPAVAAADVAWKVWSWPDGMLDLTFRSANIPPAPDLVSPEVRQATLDQALGVGAALELSYTAPGDHTLVLTEGPSTALAAILRRTAPAWIRSDRRAPIFQGTPHEMWVMHDAGDTQHWAMFELDQTLVLLDYHGREPEFETVLSHIGELQAVHLAPDR